MAKNKKKKPRIYKVVASELRETSRLVREAIKQKQLV